MIQWSLIVIGLVLISFWLGARLLGELGQRSEIRRFQAARQAAESTPEPSATASTPVPTLTADLPADTSLWAKGRIAEWKASLDRDAGPPLAILRIPKIDLEVAVLAGTDELVLNRGVGHIDGTALPGEGGNVGIAGHRDGYFRGLKDISAGDRIELETLTGVETYQVTDCLIVDPPDVWVLEPTEVPTLTLVTCYPFYFVGSAPKRFIVRAEPADG